MHRVLGHRHEVGGLVSPMFGPYGGFDPASLFANGESGSFLNTFDLASMFQDAAATVPVAAAGAGDPFARILDQSGNGMDGLQNTNDDYRPTLSQDGARWYGDNDGVDDHLSLTSASLTADMYAALTVKTTDTGFVLLSGSVGGGRYVFRAEAGAGSTGGRAGCGSPVLKVDGVIVVAGRGELYTAIADGAWHVLEAVGLDLSSVAWETLHLGKYYAGQNLEGLIGPLILTETPSASDQTKTREWLASKMGVLV